MAVALDIGPSGLPPDTSYSYDQGLVTLGPRPEVSRTAEQMRGVIRSIKYFAKLIRNNDPSAPMAVPEEPFRSRIEVGINGTLTGQYRCAAVGNPNMILNVSQDLATRVSTFEERPERTISLGDFDLFVVWLDLIVYSANR